MKRKIIACSLLVFLIVGGCFSLLFRHTVLIPQTLITPVAESQEIVAPAIIDAVNDITRVPTIQNGIVKKINVTVGQMVKKGAVLFALDDTVAQHNVTVNKIALQDAENNLTIQKNNLKHAQSQLKRLKSIDKRAINQADLREKTHEIKMAVMQLVQLKHHLDSAKANLSNAELALNQYNVVAPKDGIVLQINAHVDEFLGSGSPIILLGDAQKVIVRVSIDERDVRKFASNSLVYLTNSEDDKLNIPLTFIQLDGYIIVNDRLNARVQEAIYFFDRSAYPKFAAGRQFDAHIAVKTT
jgi:membrane fusion protein, macrolide-specific efflux system